MIISMREQVEKQYSRRRNSYIQSVVLFAIMCIVTTLSVMMWFIMGEGADFCTKLCASYLFLSIDFALIIGCNSFATAVYVLRCGLNMRALSRDTTSAIYFIFAVDVVLTSIVCTAFSVLEIQIGAFGTIHLLAGYVPMAFFTVLVFLNRLYCLFARRERLRKFKRYLR